MGLILSLDNSIHSFNTGKFVLDQYTGAAAAYSLRRLSVNTTDVVRVRRSVDNAEADFTADEITNGTMLDWVNASMPLPLDTATAAAAYSLRNLKTSYTGSVIRVRRSSDNAEADFTAAEVADGTLENWVNTDVDVYTSDFTSGNEDLNEENGVATDGETIDGVSDAYKFTLTGGSGFHSARKLNFLDTTKTYRVTFDYYLPSSNTSVDGLFYFNSVGSNETFNTLDEWVTITKEGACTNDDFWIRATDGGNQTVDADGDVFYLKNIVVTQTTADGHVTTWYDQAGSNDATQATAASQPKIVDAGVLVEENGKPAVDFDGSDDHLVSTSAYPTQQYQSTFYVASSTGTNNRILDTRGTGAPTAVQGWHHKYSQTNLTFDITTIDNGSSTNLQTIGITRTGQNLVSVFMYGGSGSSIDEYTNGSLSDSVTDVNNIDFDSGNDLYIGANVNGASSQLFGGKIQDVILYNSDQSSNRGNIETNINDYYSIYAQDRDGFVTTWYDQSGNGNDAVQNTAAEQPKIVDAGVLVEENGKPAVDFDGVDDYMNSLSSITANSIFLVDEGVNGIRFSSNGSQPYIQCGTTSVYRTNVYNPFTSPIAPNTYALQTFIASGASDPRNVSFFANGLAATENPISLNVAVFTKIRIANYISQYLSFKLQEIILYSSDQSSNRVGIETNINDYYNIYP